MITLRNGNLLEQNDVEYLVHQCNLFKTLGAGIALAIARKYPEAVEADNATLGGDGGKLGTYSIACAKDGKFIVNLYSQFGLGGAKRQTSYDNMIVGLETLRDNILQRRYEELGDKRFAAPPTIVGVPHGIGCGLANGNFTIVEAILRDVFEKEAQINLVICKFDPRKN